MDSSDSGKGRDNFIVSTFQWSGRKTSSSSCVNPSFSSILGPFWFTELLLFYRSVAAFDCMRVIHPLLPLPLSSGQWLVTYFAGIFPCSAAALHRAYTSFVRLTDPDQPTHQPVTHRCCDCAGNRIPGTTKYIANRRHRTKGSWCPSEIDTHSRMLQSLNRRNTRREEIITRDWRIGFVYELKDNGKKRRRTYDGCSWVESRDYFNVN